MKSPVTESGPIVTGTVPVFSTATDCPLLTVPTNWSRNVIDVANGVRLGVPIPVPVPTRLSDEEGVTPEFVDTEIEDWKSPTEYGRNATDAVQLAPAARNSGQLVVNGNTVVLPTLIE